MEDTKIKVSVDVQEAEAGLDKVINKSKEAKKELKDLNNTTKDSVPTVGSLDKAWESAFDNITEGLGSTGTSIRKIVSGVKGAIPVIKNLNNTAITGLKGIKAAIASTGLGVVVLILGEILAHWEDIANWIGIGTKRQEEYTRAVEQSEAAMDRLNFQHEKEIRLLKAAGASNTEIAEAKVRQTEEDRKQLDLLYMQNMARTRGRKERKQLTEEYKQQTEEANKAVVAAKRELEIVKEEEKIRAQRAKEEEEERKKSGGSSVSRNLKETVDDSKAVVIELKQYTGEAMSVLESFAKNTDNLLSKETQNWFVELLKPESPRKTTEEVVKYIQIAYNEINKTIENEEDKLKLDYQTYQGLLAGDAQTYKNKLEASISERHKMMATGRVSLEEDLKKELEIQKQAYANEEILLTKRRDFLLKNGIQGTEFEDITSQLTVLADERETFIREQARKIASAVLEEQLGTIDAALEAYQDQGDRWAGLNGGLWNFNKWETFYKQQQQAQADYFLSMRDSYDKGTAEYEKYTEEYEKITERLNGFDGKRTQFVFQQINQQYKYWNDLIQSVGSLFGSLADYYEEDIKARRKNNEIGEEQAKEEFERVKKLQLAEVWMNTLAGAIGAFLQASAAYPAPWGQILGTTTAATVLASGIAQHTKIKNTEFGDTGGGGDVPSVGVTPIRVTDDIQQSPSVLAQSQSPADQKVYILESDIQDSNRRVEVRESNSTF